MKTMKIVLFATLVLAGTSLFAQRSKDENNRQLPDDQKTEVRVEKENPDRKSNIVNDKKPNVRNQEIIYSERGRVRYSEKDNKNIPNRDTQGDNRGRVSQNREREIVRFESRNERNRMSRPGNDVYDRRNRHEEVCPLCYGPSLRRGFSIHYSESDLARIETNRLTMVLDLTDRQMNSIFSINLKYLSRRSGMNYLAMERREAEIRRVLRLSQLRAYKAYVYTMDENDFCDNCSRGLRNGHFSIAFQVKL